MMYLKKKISKIRVTKYGSLFQDKNNTKGN